MAKRYVVGFLLSEYGTAVVLVRKNRPAWQAGKLNGVGGKVEPGETDQEAMAREFEEETGWRVEPNGWDHLCTIEWADDVARVADAEPSCVVFFRHVYAPPLTYAYGARLQEIMPPVTTTTDEKIEVHRLDKELPRELIPNLTWLLPLARYRADRYEPFTVRAEVAEAVV